MKQLNLNQISSNFQASFWDVSESFAKYCFFPFCPEQRQGSSISFFLIGPLQARNGYLTFRSRSKIPSHQFPGSILFCKLLKLLSNIRMVCPKSPFLAALTNFFFVPLSSSSCRDNNHLHRKSSNTPEKQHFSRKKKRKAVLLGHPPKMARKP